MTVILSYQKEKKITLQKLKFHPKQGKIYQFIGLNMQNCANSEVIIIIPAEWRFILRRLATSEEGSSEELMDYCLTSSDCYQILNLEV